MVVYIKPSDLTDIPMDIVLFINYRIWKKCLEIQCNRIHIWQISLGKTTMGIFKRKKGKTIQMMFWLNPKVSKPDNALSITTKYQTWFRLKWLVPLIIIILLSFNVISNSATDRHVMMITKIDHKAIN